MRNTATLLLNMYQSLFSSLGPSRWWPGSGPFEVALGAILTQNTNWNNVEKAIARLRERGMIDPRALLALPEEDLAELIRPAGYFRLKTKRLRNFLFFLRDRYDFDIHGLAGEELEDARSKLLEVSGVGPETADSVLLYALDLPTFVVDAYTHRVCHRHGLVAEDAGYDEIRDFFMAALPEDPVLFNEFHALLVRVSQKWCKKNKPRCQEGCPLAAYLE